MLNLSLVKALDIVEGSNPILSIQLHGDFTSRLIGTIARGHIIQRQVFYIVYVKQWLAVSFEDLLFGGMFEQLLLVVNVFVLVVLLVGGVGNKDGVDAAEQLGLELQVLLHELLPELPLGLVQRHGSHEGGVQLGDFLEETLAVSLLNCVPRLLSLLVLYPRECERLVRDTRPLEVCRIKPLYTQCLI